MERDSYLGILPRVEHKMAKICGRKPSGCGVHHDNDSLGAIEGAAECSRQVTINRNVSSLPVSVGINGQISVLGPGPLKVQASRMPGPIYRSR